MEDKQFKMVTFSEDGLSLDVRFDVPKETVWLTQAEMAELFGVNVDTAGLHLRNIYREKELEDSTYEESSVVRMEGNRRVRRRLGFMTWTRSSLSVIVSNPEEGLFSAAGRTPF